LANYKTTRVFQPSHCTGLLYDAIHGWMMGRTMGRMTVRIKRKLHDVQNKVPANFSWRQCRILVMPLSEGLTICSDLKAPAQSNNQGQRWTLVTSLFEGLVMRNDHSEICRNLSSCFVELVALWGEVECSAMTFNLNGHIIKSATTKTSQQNANKSGWQDLIT
jgi:hypothetical protein